MAVARNLCQLKAMSGKGDVSLSFVEVCQIFFSFSPSSTKRQSVPQPEGAHKVDAQKPPVRAWQSLIRDSARGMENRSIRSRRFDPNLHET